MAALPLERIAPLLNARLLAADPTLANLRALAENVEWMNGVQFYLRRDVPTAHGHVVHIDTEWALTSISQLQFWRDVAPEQFGDSDVRGVLSVDVSDWTAPGSDGRPAVQCSREEVVRETWRQLKRSINIDGELLRDDDLHSWFLDPDIENDPAQPGLSAQFGAAAGEPGRHLGAAPRGDHGHSEPVSGVGLRAHQHRSRDDGGRQRGRATRGERIA